MLDVEPLILDELHRLSPLDKAESGDWEAILTQASPQRRDRRNRRTVRWTAAALGVALAVVIPALAFSGTVRSLVGIGSPAPRYDEARLRIEVKPKHKYAYGQNYVYRLWTAPSTQGGSCIFTTEEATPTPPHPSKISGGGYCSVGRAALVIPKDRLTWSLGTALGDSFLLDGVAGSAMHVAQMTLRWHGGSQRITTHDGFFLGLIPIALDPSFRLLPFDLVGTDGHGRMVATQRIPTNFLYPDWKRVKPKLRAYRNAHGCNKTPPLWQCRSR
jgi:hypothetical protein